VNESTSPKEEVNLLCLSKISTELLLFSYKEAKKKIIFILDNCREDCYLFYPTISAYLKDKLKRTEELISLSNLRLIYKKL
jgi:hypothetical protein